MSLKPWPDQRQVGADPLQLFAQQIDAPAVVGDGLNVQAGENFGQLGSHELIVDRRARRRAQVALAVPHVVGCAVTDVFEALTAVDRPYKRGKTLSETLAIMARMRDARHDADLFELFLRAGVFRQYAERFMRPEQIDAVAIDAYLREPVHG